MDLKASCYRKNVVYTVGCSKNVLIASTIIGECNCSDVEVDCVRFAVEWIVLRLQEQWWSAGWQWPSPSSLLWTQCHIAS